jgi:hypothetical protein
MNYPARNKPIFPAMNGEICYVVRLSSSKRFFKD